MALSQLQTRKKGIVLVLSLENLRKVLVFRAPLIAVCIDITVDFFFAWFYTSIN